jgi:creatinine amidohydrolase
MSLDKLLVLSAGAMAVLLWSVEALASTASDPATQPQDDRPGILLEDLTWIQAGEVLGPDTVVVIPMGAQSKEHGPHLKLKNDWLTAEYLKNRVLERADVVIAPTVNYGYYPAFLEYPGSISLRMETSRDMLVDICRSLSGYGPRRFYVINTGVSTLAALRPAAEILAGEGIVLHYTNILTITEEQDKALARQEGGTHADELETSMMLYIAPDSVTMSKAVKDYNPDRPGPLTRDPQGRGVYSPTGTWGDPTLATIEKGEVLTRALVEGILAEIEQLRRTALTGPPLEKQ